MSNEQLNMGDRVELLDLDLYVEEASQGLVVGNTATVLGRHGGEYLLRTDNARDEEEATCGGIGWMFPATSLRKLP
jgi:hypothetical protein